MDNDAIVAALPEHGTDSGCGDEMHFMITQGIRDRKTLKVNYPLPNKKGPAGEVNPATQQLDFYIRSPKQDPRNTPNREVFAHFFAMEVTWK